MTHCLACRPRRRLKRRHQQRLLASGWPSGHSDRSGWAGSQLIDDSRRRAHWRDGQSDRSAMGPTTGNSREGDGNRTPFHQWTMVVHGRMADRDPHTLATQPENGGRGPEYLSRCDRRRDSAGCSRGRPTGASPTAFTEFPALSDG